MNQKYEQRRSLSLSMINNPSMKHGASSALPLLDLPFFQSIKTDHHCGLCNNSTKSKLSWCRERDEPDEMEKMQQAAECLKCDEMAAKEEEKKQAVKMIGKSS